MSDPAAVPPTPPPGKPWVFELENGNRRGMWWPAPTLTGRTALITCPKCGVNGNLLEHTILADGTVAEGLACVEDDCDWESPAILAGWASVVVNLS